MSTGYRTLITGAPSPEDLTRLPPLALFSDASLAFIEAFSAGLMRHPAARAYPELMALAFWMRHSNLERLRNAVKARQGDALLVPRGTVFHIAPSNVDTIFVYSWFLALLVGNRNIVRLSGKPSAQVDHIVDIVATLITDSAHAQIGARTMLVRYERDDSITARFSAVCDVRVIWGGDDTVQQIKQIPLPPASIEIAFADKYSLAIIGSKAWLDADPPQKDAWVVSFYNDAYWFDQMACSSPRLFLWIGDEKDARRASAEFWPRLEVVLSGKKNRFGDEDYVSKLIAADSLAIESQVEIPRTNSNDLVRVWLKEPALHEELHCGAGLFFESVLPDLISLSPLLSRKVQTVAYAGFTIDEIIAFVKSNTISGIDRFAPFGHALDFSPVWDGIDLPRFFMREIDIG